MHPVVYGSQKEYDFEAVYRTVNSESKLTGQHLFYFAVANFATCFDPHPSYLQAYMNMNIWCQLLNCVTYSI
jgi:hypothetical protein